MPKRMIDSALDVMQFLKGKGFTAEAPGHEVVLAIRTLCGGRPDTVARYINFMQATKLITRGENPEVWKLDFGAADGLVGL